MAAPQEPWFHFRWMLRNFYIWPVRRQGWLLVAFALLCVWAGVEIFPRWPGPPWTFWALAAALFALLVWTVIRHAKPYYPEEGSRQDR